MIFEATVDDVDVSPDWLSVSWSSDKDGELGESTPDSSGSVAFPYSDLSVATHVVTLNVTDEVGATCSDYIIYSVGTPPSITIDAPVSGDIVDEGDVVSFQAMVSDGEDTPTDLALSWTSDIDGEFSTQGSDSTGAVVFTESGLSVGTHTIRGLVTDTDGLYAEGVVLLQVNGLPTAPEVALSPDPAVTSDDLTVAITADATDPDGDPISYRYAWYADGVLDGLDQRDPRECRHDQGSDLDRRGHAERWLLGRPCGQCLGDHRQHRSSSGRCEPGSRPCHRDGHPGLYPGDDDG